MPEATIVAPFAGTVIAIARAPEEHVRAGAAVIVLEAMKMEHRIEAPVGGTVREVRVKAGELVASGATLVTIGPV